MGKTLVILATLTMLLSLSQGINAPIYPNQAFISNKPFEHTFSASNGDILKA